MIIYVDIDETICYYEGERNYPLAIPYKERINHINKLYDEGNEIVYWTARGAISKIDWLPTTKKQLDAWGCKYHGLKLGKPHYDIYIDDKSINCETYFTQKN